MTKGKPSANHGDSATFEVPEVEVFPNPADDVVNIHAHALEGKALLQVVDCTGRVVYTVNMSEGQDAVTIDLNKYQFINGVYFVSVQTSELKITNRFVVSR